MIKIGFLMLVVTLSAQVHSQEMDEKQFNITALFDSINYVKNPSFDEYSECPVYIDRLNKVRYWRVPPGAVLHSPEFFHRCSNKYEVSHDGKAGVPENAFGYQEPRTGDGYIGFGTFSRFRYVENVQTQLKQPLEKGIIYRIGMYVSLSEMSKYANDRFTFCFTQKPEIEIVYKKHRGSLNQQLVCPNGVMYKSNELLTDTLNWVNIEVEYTATGGEKYLTLGVFDGDISWWERQRKIRNIFNEKWDSYEYEVAAAYYYIDDVYVIPLEGYLDTMRKDENE